MTKMVSPIGRTCDADASRSSWRYSRCGMPAILVGEQYGKVQAYCRKHVAGIRRRRYGQIALREPTVADAAALAAQDAAEASRLAEQREAKRVESEKRAAAHEERRAAEAAREWEVLRDDDRSPDWSSPGLREDIVSPRWKIQPTDGTRSSSFGEQSVTIEQDGPRTVLKVRSSSEMDLNEARAFVAMMTRALDEVAEPVE